MHDGPPIARLPALALDLASRATKDRGIGRMPAPCGRPAATWRPGGGVGADGLHPWPASGGIERGRGPERVFR